MLYVGRLQTAHGTRVRHKRDARLEAGRVRCMRHARARLEKATVLREIVVVLVLASPSGVVLECEHVFFMSHALILNVRHGGAAAVPEGHVVIVGVVIIVEGPV